MEFVDETVIQVRSGDGGDGVVRFRHERNIPLGGPAGGDGGRGGSVILRASRDVDTLLPLARNRRHFAKNGEPGGSNQRHGADAPDVVVPVPVGTVVHVREAGGNERAIHDLAQDGDEAVVAAGGLGGRGNRHFASALRQAPTERTYGGEGVARTLRLELKLIADVGLLGLPNAGKSTLLSRLSAARPKIADYPFTTLRPQLGIVDDVGGSRQLVLADIPGIIEGAAEGAGMGLEFLRHVERCRLLLHLVDLAPVDGSYPWDNWRAINAELAGYSPALASRPQLLVGNKNDLTGSDESRSLLEQEADAQVLSISAVTGDGLKELRLALFAALEEARASGREMSPVASPEAEPTPAGPRRKPRPRRSARDFEGPRPADEDNDFVEADGEEEDMDDTDGDDVFVPDDPNGIF